MPTIKRALISVSDKTNLVSFAQWLHSGGVEILSTGGTAKLLKDNKIPVVDVSDYTGFPEMLDGRVKTLHPKIHAGILAMRDNPSHQKVMLDKQIPFIDLVVINLYPFEQAVAKKLPFDEIIENIDIGGPTMVRAAAKNWKDVSVLVDPADYELFKNEKINSDFNFRLAQKAFAHTSRYDSLISNYLSSLPSPFGEKMPEGQKRGSLKFPKVLNIQMSKIQDLRYGENPHQGAAFYRNTPGPSSSPAVTDAKQLHGKELSFNNILDLDASWGTVCEFQEAALVIVKHTNPCGVAVGEGELKGVFVAARDCDPQSAFGGIIACNRIIDAETAAEIGKDFYEAVIAPGFEPAALELLKQKKNIRLLELNSTDPSSPPAEQVDIKKVSGGFLVQDADTQKLDIRSCKVATKRAPTEDEWKALRFAWTIVKHIKSNAVVFAKSDRLVGVGAGQMSRIDSTRMAIQKAQSLLKGTVFASDAFFPFKDVVEEAIKAGATAIIQPGGSLRDAESIEAANQAHIAMVLTGMRHFKH